MIVTKLKLVLQKAMNHKQLNRQWEGWSTYKIELRDTTHYFSSSHDTHEALHGMKLMYYM